MIRSDKAAAIVRRRRMRLGWSLTRRILAVNLLAPVILVVGLLYLDRYRDGLIEADLSNLRTQAQMFAAAVGEGAVVDEELSMRVAREAAAQMVRRLAEPMGVRARLFGVDGSLMADSRVLVGPTGMVQIEDLPPAHTGTPLDWLRWLHDRSLALLMPQADLPPYTEKPAQTAHDYPEVIAALGGDHASALRTRKPSGFVLSAAVPVQRYKQVVGAMLLTSSGERVEAALFEIRLAILQMFTLALAVTVLLSLYLAGTIARPLRRLALAAERVRRGHGRRHDIPQFSHRQDEIGELALALREMTEALWRRMDAVEAFAADVAHEIKNPLTSLRSAVETAARVTDPAQRERLMAIIQDDVQRLDRLISDISDASRLDAELSRAEAAPVSVTGMMTALADVYRATNEDLRFALEVPKDDPLGVVGLESRLVQVLRNLIANAISFSPPGGLIRLVGLRDKGDVVVLVEDEGPGIPGNKLEAIFDRFYSERPEGEKFGTHSGLGLSISKQIVDAHGGVIAAENRAEGGARFIVRLPAANG